MRKKMGIAIFVALLVGGPVAVGDSPLPPPATQEFWSPDRKIRAVADVDANTTTVFRLMPGGVQTKLWAMVGWNRDVHVSNDGEHVVIGYSGLNLIPPEYKKSMPMVYFVEKGELKKVVTLEDLVTDFSKLQRTVSHFSWGSVRGFNAKGQFEVVTVTGVRTFEVTGKEVGK